jgi:hypothetical protein
MPTIILHKTQSEQLFKHRDMNSAITALIKNAKGATDSAHKFKILGACRPFQPFEARWYAYLEERWSVSK